MINEHLNEEFRQLKMDYYKLYPQSPYIDTNIIFTENLNKELFKLRPDLKKKLIKDGIKNHADANGRMVLPKKIDDTIWVLLNKAKIREYIKNNTMTHWGTLAHELTHATDYYQMARKENLQDYDQLAEPKQYLMFQMWSEYHARRLGYKFLRNQLKVDLRYTKEVRINQIINKEIPYHLEQFNDDYKKSKKITDELYYTMNFVGHVSVWCDLFPDVFNDEFLKDIFSQCLWLYNIFDFMRKYDTLDSIYNCFDEMRLMLNENGFYL